MKIWCSFQICILEQRRTPPQCTSKMLQFYSHLISVVQGIFSISFCLFDWYFRDKATACDVICWLTFGRLSVCCYRCSSHIQGGAFVSLSLCGISATVVDFWSGSWSHRWSYCMSKSSQVFHDMLAYMHGWIHRVHTVARQSSCPTARRWPVQGSTLGWGFAKWQWG